MQISGIEPFYEYAPIRQQQRVVMAKHMPPPSNHIHSSNTAPTTPHALCHPLGESSSHIFICILESQHIISSCLLRMLLKVETNDAKGNKTALQHCDLWCKSKYKPAQELRCDLLGMFVRKHSLFLQGHSPPINLAVCSPPPL